VLPYFFIVVVLVVNAKILCCKFRRLLLARLVRALFPFPAVGRLTAGLRHAHRPKTEQSAV